MSKVIVCSISDLFSHQLARCSSSSIIFVITGSTDHGDRCKLQHASRSRHGGALGTPRKVVHFPLGPHLSRLGSCVPTGYRFRLVESPLRYISTISTAISGVTSSWRSNSIQNQLEPKDQHDKNQNFTYIVVVCISFRSMRVVRNSNHRSIYATTLYKTHPNPHDKLVK